ncbi:DUF2169 domain-containing protein [Rhizobium laguerreae]
MPEVTNFTPYPNFRYYSNDSYNRQFGVIVVKATFELASSGRLVVAEEQAPLVFTDLCHGPVNVTSLWHPSDMVPYKPATDVIVNAVARAPGGRPKSSWECSVKVEDEKNVRLEKSIRVTGPREWKPRWRRKLDEKDQWEWQRHIKAFERWELTEAAPISELPLHYEYAYGGEVPQGTDPDGNSIYDTDQRNPLGRGKIDRQWTDHCLPVAAPQIEAVANPVSDPYAPIAPEGFGPIPPAWLPRRLLGGTYDQNWKDKIWPSWPPDYDFSYHNSAHPELILEPHLKGTERLTLRGLAKWSEVVAFDLPSERLFNVFLTHDGEPINGEMKLDTVFLDIAPEAQDDWRVYLSWRVNFELGAFAQVRLYRNTPEIAAAFQEDQKDRSQA